MHSLVGTMTNALRRGGPPCPPAPDGLVICHRMFCLHGVSGFGRHQDDRDDHQPPPGARFPQSRECTLLSCVRMANSPGRLCLRPPPNTPLRTIRFCCLILKSAVGCKKPCPPALTDSLLYFCNRYHGREWQPAPTQSLCRLALKSVFTPYPFRFAVYSSGNVQGSGVCKVFVTGEIIHQNPSNFTV